MKTGKTTKIQEIVKAFDCFYVGVQIDTTMVIDGMKSGYVRNKSPAFILQRFFCIWIKIKREV